MEDTQEQHQEQRQRRNYDWLKQYQFQKGKSGNPGGAPKGKRLKTFALEMLESMDDEEKAKFLKHIDPRIVWEMAEGKAETKTDLTTKGEKIVFMPQELLNKHKLNDTDTSTEHNS